MDLIGDAKTVMFGVAMLFGVGLILYLTFISRIIHISTIQRFI